jgi:glycosyltransferase involved in cell wall biosynthesis
MPPGHEHEYNPAVLAHEEIEYEAADYLLCPSDFVARTFKDIGFQPGKLLRHQYGFDDKIFYCDPKPRSHTGLTVLFAGGCAPRKGLHYALDAWLQSSAHETGTFFIAGEFIPGYAERLASQLSHHSVRRLGHRSDIPELMRESDILILPSIEEGSALVTSEARGSGCVLLVSDAAGAVCRHELDALVHRAGDVRTLTEHINRLHTNRPLLRHLRDNSLQGVQHLTWRSAGVKLLETYVAALSQSHRER